MYRSTFALFLPRLPCFTSLCSALPVQPPVLTPGALSLVTALRNTLDVRVFLVSGGFRPLIAPAAIALGLNPETEVVANAFVFDDNAATTGADDSSVYATVRVTSNLIAATMNTQKNVLSYENLSINEHYTLVTQCAHL